MIVLSLADIRSALPSCCCGKAGIYCTAEEEFARSLLTAGCWGCSFLAPFTLTTYEEEGADGFITYLFLPLVAGGAVITGPTLTGKAFGDDSLYNYNYYFPTEGAPLPALLI